MLTLGLTGCSPKPEAIQPEEPPGSLVVSAGDAAIFTINPQGTDRFDLVEERSGRVVIQPTWSPLGDRIVWTEVDHMSERPEASIVISGPGGEELRRVDASVAPFYYHWDPSGRAVAFLASGPGGTVDLGVVDQDLSMLGKAQPFYFAWSPDGHTLLTHTDLEEVALLPIDGGAPTILEETPARFQAPQWSDSGDHVIYAIGSPPSTGGIRAGAMQTNSNSQEIVVATPQGEIVQTITGFVGVATFELSPDGTRVAHSDTLDRAAFNFGPLIVTDLASGKSTTVSSDAVLAFQWSPTGDSLLYLGSEEGIDHPSFRWAVWDGETSTKYGRVAPTVTFATDYLPFWDQYSRSHHLWSPDGSAFVYSGTDTQGDPAVWVQMVGDGSEPRRVATGDVAFWSPK
jgi:Tol biopolymer transport system component